MESSDEGTVSRGGAPIGRRAFLHRARDLTMVGIMPPFVFVDQDRAVHLAIPVSLGYLLVDTKKCQGCLSCMMACSLVHEGESNLSAARIQVLQNSFVGWPEDVVIEQCRQCETPACVPACPTGALTADPRRGNIRRIDPDKCIGCGKCLEHCPFVVKRLAVIEDDGKAAGMRVVKCDLCADAPYHWSVTRRRPDWRAGLCRGLSRGGDSVHRHQAAPESDGV
jgi:Fe-S-cluster-containing hydrogenase component 2